MIIVYVESQSGVWVLKYFYLLVDYGFMVEMVKEWFVGL